MKNNAGSQNNYDKLMQDCIRQIEPGTPLLLHVCCAPCSTSVLERLADTFTVTLLYYNPNIAPPQEYFRRLDEVRRLVYLVNNRNPSYPISLIETDYRPFDFFEAIQGLENEAEGGKRCTKCYLLRLEYTAAYAAQYKFRLFTTTLSVSPHKDPVRLNIMGELVATKHGVEHLPADFKKRDGFRRSLMLSDEYGLYRQDYCGCVFSLRAAEKRREEKDASEASDKENSDSSEEFL